MAGNSVIRIGAGGSNGSNRNGASSLTISGSALLDTGTTTGLFQVGSSNASAAAGDSGTINLNGGTLLTNRAITGGTVGTSTFNFNGGVFKAAGSTATLSGFTTAQVQSGGAVFDTNGFSMTLGQALSGSGALTKKGNGTLTLSSNNTYTGNTLITGSGSVLKLGAAGSFANSSTIVVGDASSTGAILDLTAKSGTFTIGGGQTLKGGGAVQLASNGVLDVQGTFSPGNSPGLFTYDGGTTLLSGTTIMEIFGANRATAASHGTDPYYDAVNVINGGTLTFGGLLTLDITGSYDDNTAFELFTASGAGSSLTGNFSSIVFAPSSVYSGLTFTSGSTNPKLWTSTATSGGQTFTFDAAVGTLVIVPEQSAIPLAGVGAALAGWSLYRRRRAAAC